MDHRKGGFKGRNQGSRDGHRGSFGGNRGSDRGGFGGGHQGHREMHKAVCAECGNECEVPFKPTEGRPVYCKDCFRKQRKF
tara:strand:- start:2893 stop:3135 length:243 start_codon:yes stop_codon:yes gene_type:complete